MRLVCKRFQSLNMVYDLKILIQFHVYVLFATRKRATRYNSNAETYHARKRRYVFLCISTHVTIMITRTRQWIPLHLKQACGVFIFHLPHKQSLITHTHIFIVCMFCRQDKLISGRKIRARTANALSSLAFCVKPKQTWKHAQHSFIFHLIFFSDITLGRFHIRHSSYVMFIQDRCNKIAQNGYHSVLCLW